MLLLVSIFAGLLLFTPIAGAAPEPVSGDVTVWHVPGKGRVHREGCRRLTNDPAERAKMTQMTLAEARAKDLQLCSKCPGSLTEGKYPKSWVEPARDEVLKREFEPSKYAPLVTMGADGKLQYGSYSDEGDRILDFSYCGYMRGEEPIPDVPVKVTLSALPGEAKPQGNMKYPVGPDSFERIQSALDKVAAMKPDADGIRGAVLLEKGTYYLSDALSIRSGVVLRGEGDDGSGTNLIFTVPSSAGSAIYLGGAPSGETSEILTPVVGTLSKDTGASGDDAYFLTMDDGYTFVVNNPRFKPELKLEPFVGEKVIMTMKAVATGTGNNAKMHFKHNMPYEVEVVNAETQLPTIDPNLALPDPPFGMANMPESLIAGDYLPSGSLQVPLEDASGFKVGDQVVVFKTTNAQWIDDLGMGERLRHIRGGKQGAFKKPWTPQVYRHPRTITAIDDNTLTLDVVLPQSIAAVHGGGYVRKAPPSNADSQCGAEFLRVIANYDTTVKGNGKSTDYHNLRNGFDVESINSWVRNCTVMHVWFAAVNMGGQFCTIRECKLLQPVGPKSGGRRYAFNIGGDAMGNLVYDCFAEDGRHDFVVGARVMGPNAFVKSTALRGGQSEPHHRWGCGTLYDNIQMLEGGSLAAINRGDSGSGHGWAGANTVIWNCAADAIVVFDPETKGENNFAIGYTGPQKSEHNTGAVKYANTRSGYWRTPQEGVYYGFALMGNGYIESPDGPVKPESLYEQQLIDRIGKEKAEAVLK